MSTALGKEALPCEVPPSGCYFDKMRKAYIHPGGGMIYFETEDGLSDFYIIHMERRFGYVE